MRARPARYGVGLVMTVIIAVFLSVTSLGCHRPVDPWEGTNKPRILASIAPLHCFAANIAEPDAEVRCLLSGSKGPHDFQSSPGDARLLSTADLFVVNGLGLEEFIEPLIQSSGNRRLRVLRTGEQIPKDRIIESEGHYHGNVFHGGGSDPHVWLGIEEAKIQVMAIRDALIEMDPGHKTGYQQRGDAYLAQLDALKKRGEELKDLPGGLVSFHDSFRYFGRSFQVTIAGVIRGVHGEEPSSGELRKLATQFREKGVRLIAVEPQYPRGLAENLAKDIGDGKVKIVELDPIETAPGQREYYVDKDYYVKKMTENIDRLRQAWK